MRSGPRATKFLASVSIRPASAVPHRGINVYVPAVRPPKLIQLMYERTLIRSRFRITFCATHQNTDEWHPLALLRLRADLLSRD
jgi:hypothetical protein